MANFCGPYLFLCCLFATSFKIKSSNILNNYHIMLSSPLHNSVVAPGTNVLVAYKVSEWYMNQNLKGACLVVRILDTPEHEAPQVLSCIEDIDTFGMIPNAPGIYAVSVEGWSSDGDTVLKHVSTPHHLVVRDDIEFDVEGYARQEGFRMIYEFGHWGEDGGRSGDGSSLAGAFSDSQFLLDLAKDMHVRSLLDAGCGALEWQPSVLASFFNQTGKHLRYHGADIVKEVVLANQQRFGDHPSMSFSELDLARDRIPTGFDLILCRHALFHNTNDAVQYILRAVSESGAFWFVATTLRYIDEAIPSPDSEIVNAPLQIGTDGRRLSFGGYRPVELEAPPFSLPPPLRWKPERDFNGKLVQEHGRQRGLALWSLPFREGI